LQAAVIDNMRCRPASSRDKDAACASYALEKVASKLK
jgi:hypothetical protein